MMSKAEEELQFRIDNGYWPSEELDLPPHKSDYDMNERNDCYNCEHMSLFSGVLPVCPKQTHSLVYNKNHDCRHFKEVPILLRLSYKKAIVIGIIIMIILLIVSWL